MPGGNSGAYNAGASFRQILDSPGHAQRMAAAKRRAVDSVIPAAGILRPLLGGLADFTQGVVGMPRADAASAMRVPPAAKPAAPKRAVYDPLGPAGEAAKGGDLSFQGLVEQVAKANGGKINLGQLSALSDIALKTTPKQKQQMPKDIAMSRYMEFADAQLEKSLAEAKAIEQTDPAAAQQLGQNAWMKWQQQYQPLVGSDPYQASLAEFLAQQNNRE